MPGACACIDQHYVTAAFVGRDDLRWPLPENLAAQLVGRGSPMSTAAENMC